MGITIPAETARQLDIEHCERFSAELSAEKDVVVMKKKLMPKRSRRSRRAVRTCAAKGHFRYEWQ